ncbi:ABC transporter permease [Afifella sp. IM 167]|uniref:ABC transporter permease n=1 Tax=Afifella sp. IM 167 TaxID=2033586 RepID=UPI001CCFF388|nr:FtsX-like permease family protein [Afifella sp. IM 167]MBZ8131915.1 ABC transporter permease [Afifella sp. IM 167]
MFSRLLTQSFRRDWRRKLLAILTIALATTLMTALASLSIDVGDKMAREMKAYGSNIHVVPKSESIPLVIGGVDYNPLTGRDFLQEADLPKIKDIFWRNNITGLSPFLPVKVAMTRAGDGGDTGSEVQLLGTYFKKPIKVEGSEDFMTGVTTTNAFWRIDGAWPAEGALDEVAVGEGLARNRAIAAGDTLSLAAQDGGAPRKVTVTGIVTAGGAEDGQILAPLALAQDLSGHVGKVASVDVTALTIPENDLSRRARHDPSGLDAEEYDTWYCSAYVSAIVHQIEEALPDASARPIWQVADSEGVVIGKIQLLMLVVALAAFASSAMVISSLLNTAVMERSREIGLMKALGASRAAILALFVGEAVVIGIIGGLIGAAIGAGLAQVIGVTVFGSAIAFPAIVILVVVVGSVLIALAGSILPSRTIAGLAPVETLYGRR